MGPLQSKERMVNIGVWEEIELRRNSEMLGGWEQSGIRAVELVMELLVSPRKKGESSLWSTKQSFYQNRPQKNRVRKYVPLILDPFKEKIQKRMFPMKSECDSTDMKWKALSSLFKWCCLHFANEKHQMNVIGSQGKDIFPVNLIIVNLASTLAWRALERGHDNNNFLISKIIRFWCQILQLKIQHITGPKLPVQLLVLSETTQN